MQNKNKKLVDNQTLKAKCQNVMILQKISFLGRNTLQVIACNKQTYYPLCLPSYYGYSTIKQGEERLIQRWPHHPGTLCHVNERWRKDMKRRR